MISSVIHEGAKGLQHSQRELTRAASEIARSNIRPDTAPKDNSSLSEAEQSVSTPLSPVEESSQSDAKQGIAEPLIELRRQEQLFDASAKVISTADDTLGSLLDIQA